MSQRLELLSPEGFPLVSAGDALGPVIATTLDENDLTLKDDDILVIAQKVISKAEGRYLDLAIVTPGREAEELAVVCDKDPRLVQAILDESTEVVRCKTGVIIVRHKLGLVLANAGIDHSNIDIGENSDRVLLLPEDPDASARALVQYFNEARKIRIGVIINDSLSRAWRLGTLGTCIGSAQVEILRDECGRTDLFGQELSSTVIGAGDEIAAAASLLMGQAAEGRPLVLVRGWHLSTDPDTATNLIRPTDEDLFR
jgi:coenzyme F420-0:L-glutamate ligase/coenzyme F420-1:gamma-L-glutamate ligase